MQSKYFYTNKLKLFLIPSVLTLIILYILLFTRIGVFFVFDVLGDIRGTDNFKTTYSQAPITITKVLTKPQEITLPSDIEQVSGIFVLQDNILLSTDQTEIFLLEKDAGKIVAQNNIFPWTPLLLRQGSLEAVTWVNDNFWLAGETQSFVQINEEGQVIGDFPIPEEFKSADITGLSATDNHLFIVNDNSTNIQVINLSSGLTDLIRLNFGKVSKLPTSDIDLLWSGIAVADEHLFLVAENYPVIVVAEIDTGLVKSVFGISGHQEFSDIAVADGRIYLPSDHNYFDARPPIRIYKIPQAILKTL